jgi:hypothetical protein
MGPRVGLNLSEKGKMRCPYRDSNAGPQARSSVAVAVRMEVKNNNKYWILSLI